MRLAVAAMTIALGMGLHAAQAQDSGQAAPPMPVVTDADIARAARQRPQITDADLARARERFKAPTDEELARVPIAAPVHVEALPAPAARNIDLAAVARGYAQAEAAILNAGLREATPALLVFISFAMPAPTLERLAGQAEASGAALVLRGLVDGSLRETVTRCQALIGQRHLSIQIDPQAFERFGVMQTPTFVLIKPAQPMQMARVRTGSAAPDTRPANFASVRGDVSIDYALRAIAARDADFEREAAVLLARLAKGQP